MTVTVTDHNIEAFLNNDLCTLILARSTCNRCMSYISEVSRMQERGALGSSAVGVMMLDQPGSSRFRQENTWLMNAEYLPYTVLYKSGYRIDGFSASRGHALADRNRQAVRHEEALLPV